MFKKSRILMLVLFVYVLGGIFCPQSEARRVKESSLQGLSLFFSARREQQANMRLLSKERNITGIPHDPYFYGMEEETQAMFDIIHRPLTDEGAILQRQQVVRDLINQLDFREANRLKSAAYGYLRILEFLLFGSNEGPYSYEETKGLRELFERGNPTISEVEPLIDEVTERVKKHEEEHRYDDRHIHLSKEEELYLYLGMLRDYGTEISSFINLLAGVSNPDVKSFSQDLALASEGLRDLTWQELLEFVRVRDFEQIEGLKNQMDNLKNKLINIGAVLTFAQYVKNNDFSPSTYDSDKPIGYRDGRNFTRRLNEEEIPNSSTADVGCVVLTGSNMSGKSYNLVTDLFIQLLGQSFGWVPAKDANLRIYGNIVYIDRADTESTRDLSAFGSEVQDKWQVLVELSKPTNGLTIAFVDEGYSTTSPNDQFALLGASVLDLIQHGVRFKIATHNEDFIRYFQDNPDFKFYYFKIVIPESRDKDVIFTYELQEGIGDSQAIAIGRNQGMPEEISQSAERFLTKNIEPLDKTEIQAPVTIEPIAYSQDEREDLMQQAHSFIGLFPFRNELTVSTHEFRQEQILEWRYPEDNNQYHSDLHETPLFLRLSDDEDFSGWGGMRRVEYESIPKGMIKQVQEMILWGATSNSKELLERQHMFEVLSKSDQLDGLIKQCLDLYDFALGFLHSEVLRDHLDDFNMFMLEGSVKAIEETYSWRSEEELQNRLDIFFSVLDMNLELLGLNRDKVGISENIAAIKRLFEIKEKYRANYVDFEENWLKKDKGSESHSQEGYERAREEYIKQRDALQREFADLVGGRVKERADFPGWLEIYDAEGGELLGVEDPKAIVKMVRPLYEKLLPHLKPVSVFDIDIELLRPFFSDLAGKAQKASEGHLMISGGDTFILTFNKIVFGEDAREKFMNLMTSFDSVHLHQFAHYLDDSFGIFSKGLANTSELWQMIQEWHREMKDVQQELEQFPQRLQDEEYVAQLCWQRIEEIDENLARDKGFLEEDIKELKEARTSEEPSEFTIRLKEDSVEVMRNNIRELEELRARFEAHDIELVKEFFGERLKNRVSYLRDEFPGFSDGQFSAFTKELSKLYAIVMFAKMIRDFGFCRVDFSENPEVNIQNGWNLVKGEDEQVKNDVNLNLEQRINIISGSNMSGKTFYEKMLIWVLLCAQSTGFAPADSVTMPIFNSIVYLDRVNQKLDMNLSAYGNEVEYWKTLLNVLSEGNSFVISCLDELGSTTSPRYQSALSFAISEYILRNGNYALVAHHNHDFIDVFSSIYPEDVRIYYLRNHIEDGGIVFEYVLEEGHQESNAIEVARTLGFDEEILQLAEEIKTEVQEEQEGD